MNLTEVIQAWTTIDAKLNKVIKINSEQFDELVSKAFGSIPPPYKDRVANIAILVEDEPDEAQRQKLRLKNGETLFGLYEGVPLPARGGASKMLPDKITLFKTPLMSASADLSQLQERINHTVWHEVAHYFGLDHERIHELEKPKIMKREKE